MQYAQQLFQLGSQNASAIALAVKGSCSNLTNRTSAVVLQIQCVPYVATIINFKAMSSTLLLTSPDPEREEDGLSASGLVVL